MTISTQSALILSHIAHCTESPILSGQVKATFPPGLVNMGLFCFSDTSKASVEKYKTQQKPAYNVFKGSLVSTIPVQQILMKLTYSRMILKILEMLKNIIYTYL